MYDCLKGVVRWVNLYSIARSALPNPQCRQRPKGVRIGREAGVSALRAMLILLRDDVRGVIIEGRGIKCKVELAFDPAMLIVVAVGTLGRPGEMLSVVLSVKKLVKGSANWEAFQDNSQVSRDLWHCG